MAEPRQHASLNDIKAGFLDLTADQQLRVLAEVALFLSFHAQKHRDPKKCDLSAAHQKLCSLNDLQLILVKHIAQIVVPNRPQTPPIAFLDQFFEEAKKAGFQKELSWAFGQCLAGGI